MLKNDQPWRGAPILRLILISQNMLSIGDVAHEILQPTHFVDIKIEDIIFKSRADRPAEPETTKVPKELRAVVVALDRWLALRTGKHGTIAECVGDPTGRLPYRDRLAGFRRRMDIYCRVSVEYDMDRLICFLGERPFV